MARNGSSLLGSRTERYCEHRGCGKKTREQKPYCPDHVEKNAYVQGILETRAEVAAEKARVKKRGPSAVNLTGLIVEELKLHLSLHGSRTVERLSREFNMDADLVLDYLTAMKGAGMVKFGRTARGSTVAKLIGIEVVTEITSPRVRSSA